LERRDLPVAQILHLDFINLTPGTSSEARGELDRVAAGLIAIDGVTAIGVIEGDEASDFDLAYWFGLRDFEALEPFGTDARYSQFLQGTVAPVLRGFAGADVKLDEAFEPDEGPAACVGLIGPDEAYDFEVREALEAWASSVRASSAAIGVAVGEKQMYRGAAIAFGASGEGRPEATPFRATVVRGRARQLAPSQGEAR
jgi:hypothetical protein